MTITTLLETELKENGHTIEKINPANHIYLKNYTIAIKDNETIIIYDIYIKHQKTNQTGIMLTVNINEPNSIQEILNFLNQNNK